MGRIVDHGRRRSRILAAHQPILAVRKPTPGREANWIPTRAGSGFEVLFPLYGPEQPLFDKSWPVPDIERL
jgi:hypothetical protein